MVNSKHTTLQDAVEWCRVISLALPNLSALSLIHSLLIPQDLVNITP